MLREASLRTPSPLKSRGDLTPPAPCPQPFALSPSAAPHSPRPRAGRARLGSAGLRQLLEARQRRPGPTPRPRAASPLRGRGREPPAGQGRPLRAPQRAARPPGPPAEESRGGGGEVGAGRDSRVPRSAGRDRSGRGARTKWQLQAAAQSRRVLAAPGLSLPPHPQPPPAAPRSHREGPALVVLPGL